MAVSPYKTFAKPHVHWLDFVTPRGLPCNVTFVFSFSPLPAHFPNPFPFPLSLRFLARFRASARRVRALPVFMAVGGVMSVATLSFSRFAAHNGQMWSSRA